MVSLVSISQEPLLSFREDFLVYQVEERLATHPAPMTYH
jgi:hypothetical protein